MLKEESSEKQKTEGKTPAKHSQF